MFGILTVQQQEGLPLTQRTALRLRPEKSIRHGENLFRMAMFCHAEVTLCTGWSDSLQRRRVDKALQWLRSRGVREAVLPHEWKRQAADGGVIPASRRAALEACAPQAVSLVCSSLQLPMGQVCLVVYGRQISQRASAQLLTLAKSLRTLRIYGEGNEELRTRLWRSCGIADHGVLPDGAPVLGLLLPGGEARDDTILTVDLSDGLGSGEGLLWQPQPLPPQGALARLPEGADPAAYASILLQKGAIQSREIHVSRLDIPESTQYNKEIVENCL